MTPDEQSARFKEAACEHVGDGEQNLTDAENKFRRLFEKAAPEVLPKDN